MKRLFALFFVLAFCVVSVSAQNTTYRSVENVAYRDAAGDRNIDTMCRVDVYYPVGKTGFSTVIWYHGGGLTGGQKAIPEALKNKGFAVVGVGYRLSPHVEVADCIDDAAAAAAWVVNNIASYGGDPQRIFVAGHSAGGYLTSMIGMDKRWLAPYGIDPDTTFVALIPYSGQVVTHFARRRELGIPDTQVIVDDMAPLNYTRPGCRPMLLLLGDRELEMLGRYEENAYFWRMMRVAGHPDVRIYEFGGFNHGNMPQAGHPVAVRYIREMETRLDK
ncbi:alpha/beta hydrolase [uncultured Alistipes sp.]|jgi:esterase/lipase|uniref:alpha/beta hydrolase n=1 Tax=uncultured Alistipes sp. TaxID=538949 RepID=UPI0025F891DD|nr:alpha/beta hydrolase [uncultured Alistipes sp.]